LNPNPLKKLPDTLEQGMGVETFFALSVIRDQEFITLRGQHLDALIVEV
tara:strand:+ start:185 stop:331 length:147 start_codon:yes stop_codon:yes gene_type:complete